MDLNQIQLPAFAIADIYANSLVDTGEVAAKKATIKTETPVIVDTAVELKYLGENKKNILVVVSYTAVVHIPDQELSFLTTMLAACKLSLADVAILNFNNYKDRDYKSILEELKSKTVFLFGVEPVAFGLPIDFPHFQVQSFGNCTFLYSPSLKEMEDDKVMKSKLWVALRRIFGI